MINERLRLLRPNFLILSAVGGFAATFGMALGGPLLAPFLVEKRAVLHIGDGRFEWVHRVTAISQTIDVRVVPGYSSSWSNSALAFQLSIAKRKPAEVDRAGKTLPAWASLAQRELDSQLAQDVRHLSVFGEQAFGWPIQCMSYLWGVDYAKQRVGIEHGTLLPAGRGLVPGVSTAAVPMHVQWGGVLVNTFVWCIVTAVASTLGHRVRQWQRLVRGRCPECAQIIIAMEGGCPECGWHRRDVDCGSQQPPPR